MKVSLKQLLEQEDFPKGRLGKMLYVFIPLTEHKSEEAEMLQALQLDKTKADFAVVSLTELKEVLKDGQV